MAERVGTELILAIVRGTRPWIELASIGINVTIQGNTTYIDNPGHLIAVAGPSDIARGLLAYRASPIQLQEWAWIILAGSIFLDLELDEQPIGDILLDALWDAAFGQAVSDQAYQAAKQCIGWAPNRDQ